MFPATLSTASFSFKDSLTTISFSSSLHSAMKVEVSDANPTSTCQTVYCNRIAILLT